MIQFVPEAKTKINLETIEQWLGEQLCQQLDLTEDDVYPDEAFASYGLTSKQAIVLLRQIEKRFRLELSPVIFWNHPTIAALSQRIQEDLQG